MKWRSMILERGGVGEKGGVRGGGGESRGGERGGGRGESRK